MSSNKESHFSENEAFSQDNCVSEGGNLDLSFNSHIISSSEFLVFQESSLETLQFERICDLLADYAHTFGAVKIIQELKPVSDSDWIKKAHDNVAEALFHLEQGRVPHIDSIGDLSPIMARLNKENAVLDGPMLWAISLLLSCAKSLIAFLGGDYQGDLPGGWPLKEYAKSLDFPGSLSAELARCIQEDGEIFSCASKGLSDIRKEVISARERAISRLEKYISSPNYRKHLQEGVITLKNGRFVLPVKAGGRGNIPGLVQDQSSSGETLFIEPYPVVPLNNSLYQAKLGEIREINKVLDRLTRLCRKDFQAIESILAFAISADLVVAKARFALQIRGIRPKESQDGTLNLISARHPLLGENCVPVDICLDEEGHCMVISGPNAGGKTLALKSAGLLCAMYQAGIRVPASPDSEMPVFRHIFCDIGDMQSIDRDLSTFSAHILGLSQIIAKGGRDDLILLDEIGTGTDPKEGTALSIAVLENLCQRGARVMVTTHNSALKEWAFRRSGVVNAAVAFDYDEMRPLYRLIRGALGRSHAFLIARRMGFSEEILSQAMSLMSQDELRVEDLIIRLERELMQTEEESKALAQALEGAQKARLEYEEKIKEGEEGLRSQLTEELQSAIKHFQAERQRLDALIRQMGQIQALQKVSTSLSVAEQKARKIRQQFHIKEEGIIKVNSNIRAKNSSLRGKVEEIKGNKARVLSRTGISFWLNLTDICLDLENGHERKEKSESIGEKWGNKPKVSITVDAPESVGLELILIGLDSETARKRAEDYLDDAIAVGFEEIRIVHGLGTGILRNMIGKLLDDHPMVLSHRPGGQGEGGLGATVVELKRA